MKTYLHTLALTVFVSLVALTPTHAQAPPAFTGTTVSGTIMSGGLSREYRIYVPASYQAGTAVPLLFNLHGIGSNNIEQENYGDFRSIADTAKFLIVHPNGTVSPLAGRNWNTFSEPGSGGVDDVAFIADLLADLSTKYSIDANRVYSTGMSNGGFMSYELACKLSSRIAAVASVTGSITTPRLGVCTPQHPTPILEIHGTADGTVPYNGGGILGNFASIPTVLSYWVQYNGATPTPVVTMLPDITTTDNSTVERSVWSGGRNGSLVTHYRIIGGGHTWPGSVFQGGSGAKNMDINASVEVWRFLRRYRLNKLTALSSKAASATVSFSVSPNPAGPDGQVMVRAAQALRPAQVVLLDALGRRVATRSSAGADGAVQLDLSNAASGVYLVQVEIAGKRYQQKLVR